MLKQDSSVLGAERDLTLEPNQKPEINGYVPKSLGDIMTSIAIRFGETVQTGEHFARIMGALRTEMPDAYNTIAALELALQKEFTPTSENNPDLTDPKSRPIPFLWVAFANLKGVTPDQAATPVLIPDSVVSMTNPVESGTTATATATATGVAPTPGEGEEAE
jgi:hypothetical protein